MDKIVAALNYIDEDLINDALQTVTCKEEKTAKERINQNRKPARINGGVLVKAIPIAAVALVICVAVSIWVNILPDNRQEDPRAHGNGKELFSFAEIYDYYPDKNMADRLSAIDWENDFNCVGAEMNLFYGASGDTSDWKDSNNWNSLLITTSNPSLCPYRYPVRLTCLFEGTLDNWNELEHFHYYSRFDLTFGDTTVYAGYYSHEDEYECYYGCYAIFESKGIIYEIELVSYTHSFSKEENRTELNYLLEVLLVN